MVSEPTVRDEVEQPACPLVPFTATAPQPLMVVPLAWKSMVPVNCAEPCAVDETVAVKVTDWLATDGLADEAMFTVVEAAPTDCDTLAEVTVKLVSPE